MLTTAAGSVLAGMCSSRSGGAASLVAVSSVQLDPACVIECLAQMLPAAVPVVKCSLDDLRYCQSFSLWFHSPYVELTTCSPPCGSAGLLVAGMGISWSLLRSQS